MTNRQTNTEKDERNKEEMGTRGERSRSEEGKKLCICICTFNSPYNQLLSTLQDNNMMCAFINYVLLVKTQKYIALFLMKLTLTKMQKFRGCLELPNFSFNLNNVRKWVCGA